MHEESSLGNSVCFIIEFLRHHVVEIFQLLMFENLCVKSCHTVYRISRYNGKMCHLHLTVADDSHSGNSSFIPRISGADLFNKSAVDFLNNLINTRKESGEQINRPFFQGLRHNCMIRIGNCLCRHIPCFIPLQSFLVNQEMHQFCNCQCRMGIIHLNGYFLMKFTDIVMLLLIPYQQRLKAGRDEEILLFQT